MTAGQKPEDTPAAKGPYICVLSRARRAAATLDEAAEDGRASSAPPVARCRVCDSCVEEQVPTHAQVPRQDQVSTPWVGDSRPADKQQPQTNQGGMQGARLCGREEGSKKRDKQNTKSRPVSTRAYSITIGRGSLETSPSPAPRAPWAPRWRCAAARAECRAVLGPRCSLARQRDPTAPGGGYGVGSIRDRAAACVHTVTACVQRAAASYPTYGLKLCEG